MPTTGRVVKSSENIRRYLTKLWFKPLQFGWVQGEQKNDQVPHIAIQAREKPPIAEFSNAIVEEVDSEPQRSERFRADMFSSFPNSIVWLYAVGQWLHGGRIIEATAVNRGDENILPLGALVNNSRRGRVRRGSRLVR